MSAITLAPAVQEINRQVSQESPQIKEVSMATARRCAARYGVRVCSRTPGYYYLEQLVRMTYRLADRRVEDMRWKSVTCALTLPQIIELCEQLDSTLKAYTAARVDELAAEYRRRKAEGAR